MALIGLDKLYYALLTKDDSTGVTYGTPKRIEGAIEIKTEPQTNSNTLYADNMAFAVETAQGEVKVSVNIEDLPLEVHAELLGHTISNGVMISSGDDKAPDVALLFESKKRGGGIRYVKLLKGKFQEPAENPKTQTDSPEYVTPTLEGTFVNRQFDKIWKKTADSTNPAFTGAAKWYQSVEESVGA